MTDSTSLTILQIIPSLDMGGAERNVLEIAAALVQAGHRSLVVSSGGRLVKQLEQSGTHHFTKRVNSKNPFIILKNTKYLIQLIKREKIDIVHVHSRAPAWSSWLATGILHVPFITSFHSAYKGKSFFKKLYNSVMARSDRIIVASRFLADHVQTRYGVKKERIDFIPIGLDLSLYNPQAISQERKDAFCASVSLPPEAPVLIMPARLSPIKGHELVLRALHRIKSRPFLCLMIGSDQGRKNYRQHLNALTSELGLENKVRFLDSTDLLAAYALAAIVLSPSQVAEGFGRVPVEAQAMGIPVIASAAGATSETILNGETGWLVPVGDVEALTSAITYALSLSKEQRRIMAEKAIAHTQAHFDIKQMCATTLTTYTNLLRPKRAQHSEQEP